MPRRYLVTGGAGFIGSNFVRYLLENEPEASVTNFDLLTYAGVKATVDELDGNEFGPDDLHAAGVVHKRDKLIKVLGKGEIKRAVTVRVHAVSEAARNKIEAAGGTIELVDAQADRKNGKRGTK